MVTFTDRNKRENVSGLELKMLKLSGNGFHGVEMDIKSPSRCRVVNPTRGEERRNGEFCNEMKSRIIHHMIAAASES